MLTRLLLINKEPAKKPAAKPVAAVAKNGSKKGKQESSSDDSSDDESSDDDDVSIIPVCLSCSQLISFYHVRLRIAM
jgi:hypothetical protein